MEGRTTATCADVALYGWRLVWEQVVAVVPVCAFLALFQVSGEDATCAPAPPRHADASPLAGLCARAQVVVIGQAIEHAAETLAGLCLAIVGLALFTFGLLNGLMPMGERLGRQLPLALSLTALLGVASLLGIAVTLAEPALGVVKTAGSLIRKEQAPHLFVLLHEQTDLLLLAVALGVGISASAGILRIRWNRGLKGPVLVLLAVTVGLSSLVHFQTDHVDMLGLAWDLGAVTTGPVTVPLVIALGMGVAGAGSNPSPLTGFGVVTLASLIPVNLVILLSLALPAPGAPAAAAALLNPTADTATNSSVPGAALSAAAVGSSWWDETPTAEASNRVKTARQPLTLSRKNTPAAASMFCGTPAAAGLRPQACFVVVYINVCVCVCVQVIAGLRALVPLVAFMVFLLRGLLKDSRPLDVPVELPR